MKLHFNVTKEARRAMVKAIEAELGIKAKYLGVPSMAYQIGEYTVEKDGALSYDDAADPELTNKVASICIRETQQMPEEWARQNPDVTISLPLDKADVKNLLNIFEAKGELIKKALGISELTTEVDEEAGTISFPWFSEASPEELHAYTKFIAALCEMSITQKRITAKQRENENEKYAFRCFLLRLGFIGDDTKADRKILLKNLDGSSAFKSGARKGGEA